jgi:hypothetical protein
VVPAYLAALWVLSFLQTGGQLGVGPIPLLMMGAGLFVLVQLNWLRATLDLRGVLLWTPVVMTVLGLAVGLASGEGRERDTAYGLGIGIVTAFVSIWLGDLTQLRHRPRVFLNYRRGDSGYVAERLYELLAARYGRRNVFMDLQSLPLGRDFRQQLVDIMKRCNVLIALIGPRWASITDDQGRRRLDQEDDYVRIELETALDGNIPIIPALIDDAALPTADQLPTSLKALPYLQGALLRPAPDFQRDFDVLLARFEETLQPYTPGAITLPAAKVGPGRSFRIGAFVVALLLPFGLIWLREATHGVRDLRDAAVSPDGRRVAAAYGAGIGVTATLRLWNTTTGRFEAERRYAGGDPPIHTVRWSPDGRWLATGGHEGTLQIWDAANLTVKHTLRNQQGMLEEIAWSPDSTRVATGDERGGIRIWRIDNGALVWSATLFSDHVSALAWSPRGDEIAAGSWDKRLLTGLGSWVDRITRSR